MSFQGTSQMAIRPGIEDYTHDGDEGGGTEFIKARVALPYKRKIQAIMAETGLNESEILRDLIERAVVIKIVREVGILGVANGEGSITNQ